MAPRPPAAKPLLPAVAYLLPYPRSFLGLLLAGFTMVALPLVGALAYSAWNTERLADQSRSAVFSASQAARASRSLVNRIGSIERLAQQVAVLNDPDVSADYARVHRSFKQVSDELFLLPLEAPQLGALNKAVQQEEGLYGLLMAQPRQKHKPADITRLTTELWTPRTKCSTSAISWQTGKCCGCARTPRPFNGGSSCWSFSVPPWRSPSRSA